jgi:large subunit ribosomal protein L10
MRTEKASILNEVIELVKASDFCFVMNYGGLKVAQLTTLRQALRKLDARAMVVKNNYMSRVAEQMGWAGVAAMFVGPTAIVTGKGDVTEVAKVLVEFAKQSGKADIKGATMDAVALSAADVMELSKLPSKDVMRGMLLGTLTAPAMSLVRVLNAPLLNVLYALKAYEDKKNGSAA